MGPLSEPRIIKTISENLVPVAVNLFDLREAKTTAGEMYRSIHKQQPLYQGFWIVSPEGKVLAAHMEFKSEETWVQEVADTLKKGIQSFGKITRRQAKPVAPFPFRGRGVRDDGSVTLAIYIREAHGGQFHDPGVLDQLTLTGKEFATLAPPSNREGTSWLISNLVAKKLCRCLSPSSDLVNMPLPKEVTDVRLAAKVIEVNGDTVIVSYEGKISATHEHPFEKGKASRGQANIVGFGRYDARTRTMSSVVFVLEGTFRNFQPYDRDIHTVFSGLEWQAK